MNETKAYLKTTGNRAIGSVLLVVLCCALAAPLARADRIVLGMYEELVRQNIQNAYPDWSESQINEAMAYGYITRAELTKTIPADALRQTDQGLEVIGRVRQIISGLHEGDPRDPDIFDKIVIESGLRGKGEAIVLSTFHVSQNFFAVDTVEDFDWLFSNRHRLAGVEPGSAAHRGIFYSLVDADGWLGLVEQPRIIEPPDLVEGTFTRFLRYGYPLREEYVNSYTYSRAPQFPLAPSSEIVKSGHDSYGPDSHGKFDLYFHQLLVAAAQARKHPGYPENMDRWAMQSMDMLCGLRFADPVLVDGEAAHVARRAQEAGRGCFAVVANAVQNHTDQYDNRDDPDRPINIEDLEAVALDLIQGSGHFAEVLLALPVATGLSFEMPDFSEPIFIDGPSAPPAKAAPAWAAMEAIAEHELQPHWDTILVARALASYIGDEANPAALRQQAKDIFSAWMQWPADGADDNTRHWRQMVWEQASGPEMQESSQQLELLNLLCQQGWGLPADYESKVGRAAAIIRGATLRNPELAHAFAVWLSIVRQTARGPDNSAAQLLALIDQEFVDPKGSGTEDITAGWELWRQVQNQNLGCGDLKYMGALN